MSKFSKGKKRKDPAISTAALPDIVFMLLFFFMVTTVFKEKESNKLEIDKIERDNKIYLSTEEYIYIYHIIIYKIRYTNYIRINTFI